MARNNATIGINVEAKTAGAQRNFAKLTSEVSGSRKATELMSTGLDKMGPALKKAGVAIAAVGAAATGAAVGAYKMADAMATAGDQAAKDGRKLGLTAESVQELGFAARRAGSDFGVVKTGLQAFSRGLNDAVTKGTGPAAEAFHQLGLSMKDPRLQSQDLERILPLLADEFARLPPSTNKTALAMKLFSRSGAELLPLLNEGSAGIAALRIEAQELGAVMSNEAAAASEEFKDAQENLKATLTGVRNDAIGPLLPQVTEAMEGFAAWAKSSDDLHVILSEGGALLVEVVVPAVKMLSGAVRTLVDDIKREQANVERFLTLVFGDVDNGGAEVTHLRGFLTDEDVAAHKQRMRDDLDAVDRMMEQRNRDVAESRKGGSLNLTRMRRGGSGGDDGTSRRMRFARGIQFPDADRFFSEADALSEDAKTSSRQHEEEWAESRKAKVMAQAEADLEARLRWVEMRREAGVDPIQLLDEEKRARLAFNDFLSEQDVSDAERIRLASERESILHKDRMARIAEEKKAREEAVRSFMAGTAMVANVQQLAANITTLAVESGIRGEKRRARAANLVAGSQAVVQAALETARSIAAFATWDIPGGIQHAAAAAAFTTAAVTAFREAGGGGGGARARGGGRGRGGELPTPTGSPQQSDPFNGGNAPSAPISTGSPSQADIAGAQARSPGVSGPGARGTVVVNFNGPMLGRPTEQQLVDLKRDMDRATKTVGAA